MTPQQIDALNNSLKDLVEEIKKDRTQRSTDSSSSTSSLNRERVDPGSGVDAQRIQEQKIRDLMQQKELAQDILDISLLTTEDMEELKRQQDARLEAVQKELDTQQAITGLTGDALAAHNDNLLKLQETLNVEKERKEVTDLQLKSRRTNGQLLDDELERLEEILEKQKEITRETEKQADATLEMRDGRDGAEDLVGSFSSMMGIQEPKKGGITSVVGGLIKGGDSAKAVMSGLTAGVARFLNPTAIAISSLQKLGEFAVYATLRFDKMAASLAQVTGQGREFFHTTMEMSQGTRGVIADTGELIEQAGKLQNSLAGVQGMSRGQVSQFAEVGLAVERLGVSTDDYTSILNHQMTVMGKTGPEAQEMMGTLQHASNELGMSFGDLSSMMASTQKDFSSFGANADKVFLKTAGTARQLGMEIGDLVALGKQFDTFDSAATSVADLNYMMGGQFLDTMEMMSIQNEEGPAGVAAKIKEQFDATGKSIEEMSRHQRMAMAEAAGMDEATMTKFLTGEIDESGLESLENAVDPMTRLAETANQTLDFMTAIGKSITSFGDQVANVMGLDKLGAALSNIFDTDAGGVGSIIMDLTDDFAGFRRFFDGLWKIIKPIGTIIGTLLRPTLNILGGVIVGLDFILGGLGYLGQGIGFVLELVSDGWKGIMNVLLASDEEIIEFFGDMSNYIGEIFGDMVSSIGLFFTDTIPAAVSSMVEGIRGLFGDFVEWVMGKIKLLPFMGDDDEEETTEKPKPVTAKSIAGGMATASKKSSAMAATMIGGIVVEKNGVPVPLTPEEVSKVEAINQLKVPSERYDVGRNPIKGGGPKRAPGMPAASTVRPQAPSATSGTSSKSDTNVAINVNSRKLAEVFEVVVEDVITGDKAGSSLV